MARTDVSSLWFWLANCLFFKVIKYYCISKVLDSCAYCTTVLTHVEKYTVGLDLPSQNVLHYVLWARGNIRKMFCCKKSILAVNTKNDEK